MSFTYNRTIRFQDTDAAGVVYFANVLAMCHEAYEESLAVSGINLKSFFTNPDTAIPIIHAAVDFLRPMFCGDTVIIEFIPKQLSPDKFEISYQIFHQGKREVLALAMTQHVCIAPMSRTKTTLPAEIIQWLHQWREADATS